MAEVRQREVRDRLAVALDTDDLVVALRVATAVRPHFAVAKVGLELYSAVGPDAITALTDIGMEVFCDLKLHDIPTTVGRSARVLGAEGARWLNAHAAGGIDMLRAFVEGLAEGADDVGLAAPVALAVTVLTSDKEAPPALLAERAGLAAAAGCDGVVCAVQDIAVIHSAEPGLGCVTPGIRPTGAPPDDQARVATPSQAAHAGSDLLVIGRAVTGADDPVAAAATIEAEVSKALAERSSPQETDRFT
jgi:orotidine-5'-phosphate decarboxylase